MSAQFPRPSGSVRIRTGARRLGTPAACILVTILAANQASTRSEASLPYLVQAAPQALRFAPVPVVPPPPVRPTDAASAKLDPEIEPLEAKTGTEVIAPPALPPPATSVNTPPATPALPANQGGVEILPDVYAPKAGVRIDEILPFFMPPEAPVSRATYELK
jgi:hypothetical protein